MSCSRVRVKICGMTSSKDAVFAAALGVDALGFIFYPRSPRAVSVTVAQSIMVEVPLFVEKVAVFVNPNVKDVVDVIEHLPVDLLQFHGSESATFCEQFSIPYIKAIPAISSDAIVEAQVIYQSARALLLDTPSADKHGGTGFAFDWSVIPKFSEKPIVLAGGLNELNVDLAISTVAPYAVDICSGVELSLGVKDEEKMSRFVSIINKLSIKN